MTVLKVEGLYKKFCRDLKKSMIYSLSDSAKLMLGAKPLDHLLRPGEFWALEDINFELKKGETVGIIGSNGSGKTTLLRLITGIYPPSAGSLSLQGRVGSLIAVGAGFHPHMSGYENIFLNGTIIGLRPDEIRKKVDEIVEFSSLGDFIHAPVATYSSGMRARLGFSIAVSLKPDLLLIDEVLSVGDISFKKKSMERLLEMKKSTATLFVSHSLRHVYRICDRVIWMQNGKILADGKPSDVVSSYVAAKKGVEGSHTETTVLEKSSDVSAFELSLNDEVSFDSQLRLSLEFSADTMVSNLFLSVRFVSHEDDQIVTTVNSEDREIKLDPGSNQFMLSFPKLRLMPGYYYVSVKLSYKFGGVILEANSKTFQVKDQPGKLRPFNGYYREEVQWV